MGKYFCCVDNCANSEKSKFSGWSAIASLQTHLNKHLNKTLDGKIPEAVIKSYKWTICPLCELLTSVKHPTHKECLTRIQTVEVQIPAMDSVSLTFNPQPLDESLPSIKEICSLVVQTTKSIPRTARTTWAHTLANCISDVTYHNSMEKWQLLFMLPKCILWRVRAGTKKKHTYCNTIIKRLEMWNNKQYLKLWKEIPRSDSKFLKIQKSHKMK